jgi:hypothetical protein
MKKPVDILKAHLNQLKIRHNSIINSPIRAYTSEGQRKEAEIQIKEFEDAINILSNNLK